MQNYNRTFRDIDEVKEALRERVSLVDYVSNYVQLEQRGRHYVGLCPFHDERTPSFNVTPEPHNSDVSFFSCFGCGKTGDLYKFVMDFHAAGFLEAIEIISEVTGFDLEPYYRPLTPDEVFAEAMYQQVEAVARFLHEQLLSTPTQLLFFEDRGINVETLGKFKVGYCPSFAELETRFGSAILQYIDPNRNNCLTVFDHNIVYPQFTAKGRIWGFYGRTGGKPKYLGTSGNSPLFQGVGRLYGLHLAKQIVRRTKQPFVIIEGFNDALAAHQANLPGIASCGTVLSANQIQALADNSVREAVICFDGDQAGFDGMMRIAKGAHEIKSTNFKFARIPGDPDEFISERGGDAFREVLQQALCAVEYVVTNSYTLNGSSATAQLDFLHRVSPDLLAYPRTSVNRELGINTVATLTGMSREAVTDFLEQFGEPNVPASMRGEQVVLAEFVNDPQSWITYTDIRASDFFFLRYRKTFELAKELYQDGATVTPDLLSIEAEQRRLGKHVMDTIEEMRTVDRTQVAAFAIQIREKGDRRAALALTNRAAAYLNDPSVKAGETLGQMAQGITDILTGNQTHGIITSVTSAQIVKEEMINQALGIGNNGLDLGHDWSYLMNWIRLMRPGRIHLLAALSGVGKSLVGVNWLHKLCMDPTGPMAAGLFVTMEMTHQEQVKRLLSIDSGVPHKNIDTSTFQSEDQEAMVAASLARYASARISWMEQIQNMRDIYSQARSLHARGELDFIMIDYVQLLDISIYNDRWATHEKYGAASMDMKQLADSLKVPLVAMAQLNKQAYDVEVATGEQLGSSYKIYQDAHVCYTLNPRQNGSLFGYVDKNRGGRKGVGTTLSFNPDENTSNLRIAEVAVTGPAG